MKTPRIEDFDPKAAKTKRDHPLTSSLDGMPTIEKAGNTAIRQTINTENQQTVHTAIRSTSNTAIRHSITPTEKVTYKFHPEGKYALEDMKIMLERKHGIKASLGELAEESILLVYEDLLKNPNASKLAIRLARKP